MRLGPLPRMVNLGCVGDVGLVLLFVGGVEVRREGLELGGAGVHALEDGRDAQLGALLAHGVGRGLPEQRQLLVAGAAALGFAQQFRRNRFDGDRSQLAC